VTSLARFDFAVVKKTHDFRILGMPREGELPQYFAISDEGKNYLLLRKQYEGGQ
jgi:hypothetical protein